MNALPEWKKQPGYEDVIYEKCEEGIAKITINRPEVRNAFRPKTVKEMQRAFDDARDDGDIGNARRGRQEVVLPHHLDDALEAERHPGGRHRPPEKRTNEAVVAASASHRADLRLGNAGLEDGTGVVVESTGEREIEGKATLSHAERRQEVENDAHVGNGVRRARNLAQILVQNVQEFRRSPRPCHEIEHPVSLLRGKAGRRELPGHAVTADLVQLVYGPVKRGRLLWRYADRQADAFQQPAMTDANDELGDANRLQRLSHDRDDLGVRDR